MGKFIASMFAVLGMLIGFAAEARAQSLGPCVVDGEQVTEVVDQTLQDVAFATIRYVPTRMGPRPIRVIIYNPTIMGRFSGVTQSFFRAHECGHHQLRHERRVPSMMGEQEADCFAIRTLAQAGMTASQFEMLKRELLAAGNHGDATHLPTPVRVQNLHHCLR